MPPPARAAEVEILFDAADLRSAVRLLAGFADEEAPRASPAVENALGIYNTACREVNDRLGECQRLLGLGQRSEALRRVQIEPDALDRYREVTLKRGEALAEACEECRLPTPQRPDSEAARRLNEAYASERQNETLYRQHRLLALERAPLRQRLDVLRLLQRADPQAVYWHDDIASYEAVRIEQLRTAMADPNTHDDWNAVRALHTEATAPDWRAPFPIDLAIRISQARDRLQRDAASAEATPLLEQLRRAMRDRDADAMRAIVAQATALRVRYDLPVGSRIFAPFEDGAKQADRWVIDEEDYAGFRSTVAKLRKALEHENDWYYVQEYYRMASEYDWPLPEEVAEAFVKRARGRRMWRLIGALAILAAVLFLATAGLVAYLIKS